MPSTASVSRSRLVRSVGRSVPAAFSFLGNAPYGFHRRWIRRLHVYVVLRGDSLAHQKAAWYRFRNDIGPAYQW